MAAAARAAVALIVAHSVSKSSCPQDRASTALAPEIKDSTKTPSSATRRRVPCRSRHIVAASASAVAFPSESHPFAGAVWNTEIAAGSVAELERIVAHLRRRWPATRIGIRGDGGFCREAILAWCERHGVAYVLGLARNARLAAALEPALQEAAAEHRATGQPARRFRDLRYRTLTSWSRTRRVVGTAEVLARGRNPRFVVTSLTPDEADARELYEDRYCIRGSMENRIKEQQLDLFADRTSAHTMRANQLRLYFSSFAYVLLHGLRRLGTAGTDLARAQCGTLRRRLLKIGTRIRITARRVWLAFSEAYPGADTFARVLANLQRQPMWRPPRASA